MATKYLDYEGLAYVKEKIDTKLSDKVDKETGKGLSANDFTSEEKTKLANVAAGAQVNVIEGIQVAGATVSPTNKIVNIPAMTGASSDAAGAVGVVPAPAAGAQSKFLRGDGTWQTPVEAATTAPKMDGTAAAGSSAKYAREDHVHASDTSRVPTTRKVNNKALSEDITLGASDVGALPDTTVIPSAGSTTPKMDGTASTGTGSGFAREDHVHPTDTSRAPLASPALTGTPTAPTAAAGNNSTQIATTAFVTNAVSTAVAGASAFQGTVTAESDISGLSDYKNGWYWVVNTAGTYMSQECEAGDMIFCVSNRGSAYKAADFNIVQTNLSITSITNAEIDTIFAA